MIKVFEGGNMGLSTVSTLKNLDRNYIFLDRENLKKLQKVLLEILIDFDEFCSIHNITYSLAGGSTLGAIRHKGFIPWDDDVDILMLRNDYEKFRKLFKKEKNKEYWIHTPEETNDYGLCFSRIRKKNTVCRAREDIFNKECGVYIDIFIVENTFNHFFMRSIHGILSLFAGLLLSCRNFYRNRKLYLNLAKKNKKVKIIFFVKIFIGFLISFLSINSLTHFWNSINKMCKNNSSKYVTVPVGRNHFFGELYKREYICNVKKHEFIAFGSHYYFNIMNGYDYYLRKMYGDYMTIPKEQDREKHVLLELDLGDVLNEYKRN